MSRKAGSISGDTKIRLMQMAAEEFAEKGFQNSSLRQICQNAGVTTGALYFFFKNKDDLFKEVIASVAKPIYDIMVAHFEKESRFWEKSAGEQEKEDLQEMYNILDFCYKNKSSCNVILNNRNHPIVHSFIDEIIKITTEHYFKLLEAYLEVFPRKNPIDDFAVHWFSHQELEMSIGLFTHYEKYDEAAKHIPAIVHIMEKAFEGLLLS